MKKFITDQYYSNCFVEALKAKSHNPNVQIFFCKPRITENGHFQMMHFMWSDEKADYDFSDNEEDGLPWYRCFWFKGAIRQFEVGFAKRYSEYRNQPQKKNKQIGVDFQTVPSWRNSDGNSETRRKALRHNR